ncbi:hypothetical protein [Tengunoibacter tsumagoiensis]|uniref:Uncharacterized protein n=1 Tax=Tengunoibacter tsumagoiensis TaxID=2014871 RepID=A0A402A7U2_9CHLR|nr:hypothetical protein [Tengunoibacter tsumagoiensis]GCE15222.1 hypothetical protein KTT_50810 [Tengunoibacter tsumagoiensis]
MVITFSFWILISLLALIGAICSIVFLRQASHNAHTHDLDHYLFNKHDHQPRGTASRKLHDYLFKQEHDPITEHDASHERFHDHDHDV